MDEKRTILDNVEGFWVPSERFETLCNEYWALVCLKDGLQLLYGQTKAWEEKVAPRVELETGQKFVYMCSGSAMPPAPYTLLTNYFHWYAISVCQLVKTVGAIALKDGQTTARPKSYAETVIPEVIPFRDKVAAHFAWATKNSQDNDAERLASIIPQVTFVNGRYVVGGYQISRTIAGKSSDSSEIRQWSLTEVHERISQRYWISPEIQAAPESEL